MRERVGVLDLGGFAKFEVSGQGAAAYLDRLVCGRLPKVGRVALAYMCTPKGGILSELTITRLAEERFYLCSAASAEWHDEQWLRAHHRRTAASAQPHHALRHLGAGRPGREVLSQIEADLSNAAFPWLAARSVEIGFAKVLALRINYVGELGWELHLPLECQLPVYGLMAAGAGSASATSACTPPTASGWRRATGPGRST